MGIVQELTRADDDTAEVRKARGAFFTPDRITRFIADWAIRGGKGDAVLEPSAGDAAFLVEAVRRLHDLGADSPPVAGVEIHAHSARLARARVEAAGGTPHITENDFFLVEPRAEYDAVIGNPPYIRYQDFSGGEARARSRTAALRAGVALTGLASSWAAFTVQSALFLRRGGRLGLVLPAELLSVNYAAAVRQFLFDRFAAVELVLFTEQVFPPEAEADVVLLLASGFGEGPAKHATVFEAHNADGLESLQSGLTFTPTDPSDKWTSLLVDPPDAIEPLSTLMAAGHFTHLEEWGRHNARDGHGQQRVLRALSGSSNGSRHSLRRVAALSPPGSSHLRGLALDDDLLATLGNAGRQTLLFRPSASLADVSPPASREYIASGYEAGVHEAYKCRVRKPWYRVPLVPPADLLLTCMNADTPPRLTTNEAAAHHLNSVHGVYLHEDLRDLGRELLPPREPELDHAAQRRDGRPFLRWWHPQDRAPAKLTSGGACRLPRSWLGTQQHSERSGRRSSTPSLEGGTCSALFTWSMPLCC